MKNIIRIFVLALAVLVVIPQVSQQADLQAQTATTRTYLTAALTVNNGTMVVASNTGFTASTNSVAYYAYIDRELVLVTAVSGTTISIRRGQGNTVAAPHTSSSTVWVGPRDVFVQGPPAGFNSGQCTRAQQTYLPVVVIGNGMIYDCILSTGATTSQWTALSMAPPTSVARPYKKMAASVSTYTALPTDEIIGYNTNVAGTITIPAMTGFIGKMFQVQLEVTGTHLVTIATSASQLINGGANIVIGGPTAFVGVLIYSDGTNWFAHIAQ